MPTLEFQVDGMKCGGCEATVRDAVGSLDGVDAVDADHTARSVRVHGSGPVDTDAVRAAIASAGFIVL
jgi:copper chaperone